MSQHTYDIDPDGDIILTLHDPNSPFAVWEQDISLAVEPAIDDPVFAIEGDLTNLDLVSEDACEPQPEDTISNPEPETRMRLSSKHLTLASRYFKTMLTAPWKETLTQAGQQQHAISAEGWDAEALLVLMRIIHGRTQGVPRVVTLDMMAKFAVLVDYYDCHEVVDCVVS